MVVPYSDEPLDSSNFIGSSSILLRANTIDYDMYINNPSLYIWNVMNNWVTKRRYEPSPKAILDAINDDDVHSSDEDFPHRKSSDDFECT